MISELRDVFPKIKTSRTIKFWPKVSSVEVNFEARVPHKDGTELAIHLTHFPSFKEPKNARKGIMYATIHLVPKEGGTDLTDVHVKWSHRMQGDAAPNSPPMREFNFYSAKRIEGGSWGSGRELEPEEIEQLSSALRRLKGQFRLDMNPQLGALERIQVQRSWDALIEKLDEKHHGGR